MLTWICGDGFVHLSRLVNFFHVGLSQEGKQHMGVKKKEVREKSKEWK